MQAHDDADLSGPVLPFIENKGQLPEQVLYQVPLGGGALYLEQDRWVYQIIKRPHTHGQEKKPNWQDDVKGHVFNMWFENANMSASVSASYPRQDYINYFQGNDPAKWASHVKQYAMVEYSDIYSCIDLSVYSKNHNLKYDLVVRPGGDPADISLQFEGMNQLQIVNGDLVIDLATGQLRELAPYAYTIVDGIETEVPCQFVLENNRVSFAFPEGYDESQELIIDPTLVFSSYVGSTADSWGFTATYDVAGHLYGGSLVFANGYPTTVGEFAPYDDSFNGGNTDMGITKFSPDGSTLVYTTYLGGSGPDVPQSLIVNNKDELVVFGTTGSNDFPVTATAAGNVFNGGPSISPPLSTFANGSDIAITVLAQDGGNLVGSSFFGGSGNDGLNQPSAETTLEFNYGDIARGEVFVDDADNIYIGSSTLSNDIQGTFGSASFQSSSQGQQDGLLAKFNEDLSNVEWWSYLGGTEEDAIYSVKVNSSGIIYACGGTESDNFPATISGLNSNYQGGSTDGYVVSIASDGSSILNGTYLGTGSYDQAYFVEIDREDEDIYIVGQSLGEYPVEGNVYSNENGRQFLHQLTPDLGSTVVSTVFGANGEINISPTALMVDECGRVYVSGWGGSTNSFHNATVGTTIGLPVTSDAFQSNSDGSDFYFIVFLRDLEDLFFGSFYGGSQGATGAEHVDGGTSRFSPDGTIYQAVCAGCGGNNLFPTTDGAWSEQNLAVNCNLGVIKYDIEPPLIEIDLNSIDGGCSNEETLLMVSQQANTYLWDLGDNTTATGNPVTHIYSEPGVYEVTVIAIDSLTCNIADTTTAQVTVIGSDLLDFEVFPPQACTNKEVVVMNNSLANIGAAEIDQYQFQWDMGNGVIIPFAPYVDQFTFDYEEGGDYQITLQAQGPPEACLTDLVLDVSVPTDEGDVMITAIYDCDSNTGVASIIYIVSGGLPQANPQNEFYTLTGDVTDDQYPYDPDGVFIIELSENSTYSLTATDASGCSDAVAGNPAPCTKTAIELLNFDGEKKAWGNLLNWSTASEFENDYFVLEVSTNGIEFEELARVEAKGNSNTANQYEYRDSELRTDAYYRLITFDTQGNSEKSKVIFIGRSENQSSEIIVEPNPFNDYIDVSLLDISDADVTIQLIALNGALVKQEVIADPSQRNRINDLSQLESGIYFLRIITTESEFNQKLVKY